MKSVKKRTITAIKLVMIVALSGKMKFNDFMESWNDSDEVKNAKIIGKTIMTYELIE